MSRALKLENDGIFYKLSNGVLHFFVSKIVPDIWKVILHVLVTLSQATGPSGQWPETCHWPKTNFTGLGHRASG